MAGGGKKGGGKIQVTKYLMSQHFGICAGPIDSISRITIKEKVAWEGTVAAQSSFIVDNDELFGGIEKEGGVEGVCYYLPGFADQILDDLLARKLGRSSGADCPGYRGIASIFMVGPAGTPFAGSSNWSDKIRGQAGFYWSANIPYLPGVWVTVGRAPVGLCVPTDSTDPYTTDGPYSGGSSTVSFPGTVVGDVRISEFDNGGVRLNDGRWYNPDPATLLPGTVWLPPFGEAGLGSGYDDTFTYDVFGHVTSHLNHFLTSGVRTSGDATDEHRDFTHAITLFTYNPVPIDPCSGMPSLGSGDANPADIIYECLTNTDWGMGSPATALNVESFLSARLALANEEFGLSMIWTRQSSIQDFIQEVLDHIQGVLYVDPATGLLTLTLIRGDYDVETLPEINPSNANLSDFSRKLWGEIPNEMIVTWTNPLTEQDETVTIQDLASIATQGGIVSDSRNYYGVRNVALAQRLAQRDLRAAGQPLASCEAEVDRTLWRVRPASVCRLTWPEYGLSGIVMRVIAVDYGRPGDAKIKLSLLEDVFGIDIGEYVDPPTSGWEDPALPPEPISLVEVLTLPAFVAVQFASGTALTPVYPSVLAGVLAASENADASGYELWAEVTLSDGSLVWSNLATNNLLGHAQLVDALIPEAVSTGVTFDNVIGDNGPLQAGFVIIGDEGEEVNEIAMFTAVGTDYTIARGVLDTVPRAWPIGTPIWFVDSSLAFEDPTVRSSGEVVEYKLRMRTSLGLLDLDDADLVTGTLTDRPWQPNRPANVTAYGVDFSSVDSPIDATARPDPWVTVAWANRNRLTEDSQVFQWTDPTVTPEDGQTTTITVLTADGATELAVHDGLTGTSFDVPNASFAGEAVVLLRTSSERTDADGTFPSLQSFDHWVLVGAGLGVSAPAGVGTFSGASEGLHPGALAASGAGALAGDGDSDSGDPYFANVVFLSGFEGGSVIDESPLAQTVTLLGTTAQSTTVAAYGSKSLRRPGATSGVAKVPNNAAFFSGFDPFTVEGTYYFDTLSNGDFCYLAAQLDIAGFGGAGTGMAWGFRYVHGSPGTIELVLEEAGNGTAESVASSSTWTATADTQYHLAATFDGTTYRIFVDGVEVGNEVAAYDIYPATSPMSFGDYLNGATYVGTQFNGYMDEVRVTAGVARYTANFTPPAAPFPRA